MRKFRSISLLLLAIIFIAVNCTKEGPEGPAGATGPQGPAGSTGSTGATGATGPAGSVNVIFSAWFNLNNWHDSTMTNQGLVKVDYKDSPGVTAAILTNGIVLSYVAPSAASTYVYSLPWTLTGQNPNILIQFLPTVGRMVYYNTEVNSIAGGIAIDPTYVWRYIIIPGGVAGGRMRDPRTMTYAEVCAAYNIPM